MKNDFNLAHPELSGKVKIITPKAMQDAEGLASKHLLETDPDARNFVDPTGKLLPPNQKWDGKKVVYKTNGDPGQDDKMWDKYKDFQKKHAQLAQELIHGKSNEDEDKDAQEAGEIEAIP